MNIPVVGQTQVEVAPAVAEVAPVQADTVVTVEPTVKKKLSKTDAWALVGGFLTPEFVASNPDLSAILVANYKPSTGGGGLKDWSKRIEDTLGTLLAKRDSVSGFWFLDECFSKNKYETKDMYSALARKRKEIDAGCRVKLMSGVALDAVEKTVYDPNSTSTDVHNALVGLMGDEINTIVANYNTLGKYLGATKEEAKATLLNLSLTPSAD